jgi:hypothetical protein
VATGKDCVEAIKSKNRLPLVMISAIRIYSKVSDASKKLTVIIKETCDINHSNYPYKNI